MIRCVSATAKNVLPGRACARASGRRTEGLVELSADAPCVTCARADERMARGTAEATTPHSCCAGLRAFSARLTAFGLRPPLREAERVPALFFPRRSEVSARGEGAALIGAERCFARRAELPRPRRCGKSCRRGSPMERVARQGRGARTRGKGTASGADFVPGRRKPRSGHPQGGPRRMDSRRRVPCGTRRVRRFSSAWQRQGTPSLGRSHQVGRGSASGYPRWSGLRHVSARRWTTRGAPSQTRC